MILLWICFFFPLDLHEVDFMSEQTVFFVWSLYSLCHCVLLGIHVFGQPKSFAPGRFYAYDLRKDAPQPRKLVQLKIRSHPDPENFHPAGIASYNNGGQLLLYAVATGGLSRIDVFTMDIDAGTAKYLRSIKDPLFKSINNLALTGLDQFYVTNMLQSTHWALMNLELAVPLGTGSLLYYDGKKARVAVPKLKAPNGVDLSRDGKQLYVATTQDEVLHVYRRFDNNTVALLEEQTLGTGMDNLNVDKVTGDIYIGSHPITYKILMNMNDRKHLAPSQVIRVKVNDGSKPLLQKVSEKVSEYLHSDKKTEKVPVILEVTEIFTDDGRLLSGATAAVRLGNKLVIGSLTDKAVICHVSYDD